MVSGDRSGPLMLILALAGLFTVPHGAAAADVSVTTTLLTQDWTIDLEEGDEGFHQSLCAVSFAIHRLTGPFCLYGYLPFATTKDDEADAKLSGMGDAQLRLSWRPRKSRWSATLGCDLPTGKTALSENEYRVASLILPSRVLDFWLKRPGEGLDLFGSVANARSIGRNTVMGFALAGYIKQEYTMRKAHDGSELITSPGNRLHGSLSLLAREHEEDPDWDLRLALTAQLAGNSELKQEGQQVTVDEGVGVTLDAAYGRRVRSEDRLALSAFLLARDRNRSGDGNLQAEQILGISTRWMTEFEAAYSRPIHGIASFALSIRQLVCRMDPSQGVNSRMTSLGLDAERSIGVHVTLHALLHVGFGRTPWSSTGDLDIWEKRNLSGTNLGIDLRLAF